MRAFKFLVSSFTSTFSLTFSSGFFLQCTEFCEKKKMFFSLLSLHLELIFSVQVIIYTYSPGLSVPAPTVSSQVLHFHWPCVSSPGLKKPLQWLSHGLTVQFPTHCETLYLRSLNAEENLGLSEKFLLSQEKQSVNDHVNIWPKWNNGCNCFLNFMTAFFTRLCNWAV